MVRIATGWSTLPRSLEEEEADERWERVRAEVKVIELKKANLMVIVLLIAKVIWGNRCALGDPEEIMS